MVQMNLLTKQKETHRLRTQTYGCRGEGIVREFGKVLYTLLYLKWITCKDLLYSTGNSAQCYVPAWMGAGFGERVCVCVCCLVCDPMDLSPPGSSIYGILQARILECVAILFSKESS